MKGHDANAPRVKPLQAFIALLCVIAGIAIYLTLGGLLGIEPLYAGFAYGLYYSGFRHADPAEMPGAIIGSLGGLAVSAMLAHLPAQIGTAGMVIVIALIALSIYALIMGWVPVLVNMAFMLMLTIATIPALQEEGQFIGMAGAVLLMAGLLGLVGLLTGYLNKRKQVGPATATV